MIRINISEARTHLSKYLKRVEEGEFVTLCRRNVPIAEIRPLPRPPREERPVGIDRGMAVPASFFDPLPDELVDAFEGTTDSGHQGNVENRCQTGS